MNLNILIGFIAFGVAIATVFYISLKVFPAKDSEAGIISQTLAGTGLEGYLQYLPLSIVDKYSNSVIETTSKATENFIGAATGAVFRGSLIVPSIVIGLTILGAILLTKL